MAELTNAQALAEIERMVTAFRAFEHAAEVLKKITGLEQNKKELEKSIADLRKNLDAELVKYDEVTLAATARRDEAIKQADKAEADAKEAGKAEIEKAKAKAEKIITDSEAKLAEAERIAAECADRAAKSESAAINAEKRVNEAEKRLADIRAAAAQL